MANKFYGNIGFIKTVEVEPGVWSEDIVSRPYFGDVLKNVSRFQSSGGVNDNIRVSNTISIVADPYANENFQHMKYVEFKGAKWNIESADASQYPRILLTLGGVYNGK